MCDVAALTQAGIDHAGDVADHMIAKIERNPHAARAVSQVAESGIFGIDREVRRYIEESRS